MWQLVKNALTVSVSLAITTTCLAAPAADHTVIIVIDGQRGLALVPEGTPIPRGLSLRYGRQTADDSIMRQRPLGDDSALRPNARPLMFVHAPDSAFEAARAAIAKGTAAKLHTPGGGLKPAPNYVDYWFYVYVTDLGAYIEQGLRFDSYAYVGAAIYIFLPSGSELMTATLNGSQSSDLSPDQFADSCGVSFINSGSNVATCATPYVYASAVSATVTTTGTIQGRTYDGCGSGGNFPCSVRYSSTFVAGYTWLNTTDYTYSNTIE